MTLVKWDPFRGWFDVSASTAWNVADGDETRRAWTPPVDVFEKNGDWVIRAELPGVAHEDIDLHVEETTLILRGERKRDEAQSSATSHRNERAYGPFSRSFRLPDAVDAKGIRARYRDGVLELTLPKAEECKPRKIEVKAA